MFDVKVNIRYDNSKTARDIERTLLDVLIKDLKFRLVEGDQVIAADTKYKVERVEIHFDTETIFYELVGEQWNGKMQEQNHRHTVLKCWQFYNAVTHQRAMN